MSHGKAKILPPNPDGLFLPFQERWINDTSRLKLMEKSRQIGVSWSTAYPAVERTAKVGAKHDQWVSSRDDIQARLFLEDGKMWAKMLDLAATDLGETVINPEKKISAYVLHFASGRRIYSMSSNPDAQAGIPWGEKRTPRRTIVATFPDLNSAERRRALIMQKKLTTTDELFWVANPTAIAEDMLLDAFPGFMWKLSPLVAANYDVNEMPIEIIERV